MLGTTRIINRQVKAIISRALMFLLLLVLAHTSFAQENNSTNDTDTQTQQITIEQRIAELETKLQSIKDQIAKAKQPEEGSVTEPCSANPWNAPMVSAAIFRSWRDRSEIGKKSSASPHNVEFSQISRFEDLMILRASIGPMIGIRLKTTIPKKR